MRAFVAIELSEELRRSLAAVSRELGALPADVKWVSHDSFHITLQFLGEVSPQLLPQLFAAIEDSASMAGPFTLTVGGIGTFPAGHRPRVIWAGGRAPHILYTMQQRLAGNLSRLGFVPDHRFSPHVTLGRVRSPRNLALLLEALPRYAGHVFGQQQVETIALMESHLTPAGAIYTRVQAFPLGDDSGKEQP